MTLNNDTETAGTTAEQALPVIDVFRSFLAGMLARRTSLWQHIHTFSQWVEYDASVQLQQTERDEIEIDLNAEGELVKCCSADASVLKKLAACGDLWTFLVSIGVCRLRLDRRLEMNQIQDVIIFLYTRRHILCSRNNTSGNAVSRALLNGRPIHFSCVHLTLKDDILTVQYSYCTLKYSHLVHWLEQRNKNVRDHRALFYMAPWSGLILGLVIFTPSLLFALLHQEWFIAALLGSAFFVLFGITYVFLMVIGSVEYDNEEKAYRLSRAYTQLQVYARRIQADIQRARTIQQCFLPSSSSLPQCEALEWAFEYHPAEEIGGDYFDIQRLDDHRVAIIFGDACGHGVAAALITAVMKTTFQAWLQKPDTLESLVQRFNQNLYKMTPDGDFAAVFVAILDTRTGQLSYINCGHSPEPWVITDARNTALSRLTEAGCMILGISEQIEPTASQFVLKPGDSILIASDGITESQDGQGNFYGDERLEQVLCEKTVLSACNFANSVVESCKSFSDSEIQKDDQTILVLRFKSPLMRTL